MKPKKFSINFIHRPEFFYAAFELELKIEGKNICEFTVDGKIEKDTANLIFLSDWFENNLKFILSEEDKFPYKIKGNCGIEIREKAYEMGNKNHEEIEWFEKIHEWSERHLWTFSGLEMVYPDVMFRKINDKIEVSWDSTNKYRDNVYAPSQELISLIVQVKKQKDGFMKDYNTIWRESYDKGINFKAFAPKCYLIIGNTSDLDTKQLESFNLFRNELRTVEIITYDELLAKMEILYKALGGKDD